MSLDMSDVLRFAPWLIVGGLLVFDVPGSLGRRFFPDMHLADATFLLQVAVLFAVTLPWISIVEGPSHAFHPSTVGPLGVLCLYLAVDWARCRIPGNGESKAAKKLETRYSLSILAGYILFIALMAFWWTQVG